MKSVYACSKHDGTLALAIDIIAVGDAKVIGALLKLAGESGFMVDRVDPGEVVFEAHYPKPESSRKDDGQLSIDFEKPAVILGPSDMGEGFVCNYSGGCPREGQSCEGCEYAGTVFQKAENPPDDVQVVTLTGEPFTQEQADFIANFTGEPGVLVSTDGQAFEAEPDEEPDDEDLKYEAKEEEELPF